MDGAIALMKELLPDFIEVACHWATSNDHEAVKARTALKQIARPFHTHLYYHLVKLHNGLLRLPARSPENKVEVTLGPHIELILHVLEERVVVVSPASGMISRSWLRGGRNLKIYGNLLNWTARSRSHDNDKLTWLLKHTRLADLSVRDRSNFLNALETCSLQIEGILPFHAVPFDDEAHELVSSKQRNAWRSVAEMCQGIEDIHSQLSKAWTCSCPYSHDVLHFAIDPYCSQENGMIVSSVLHKSSGWKKTAIRLKHTRGVKPDYQELCKDLNASADRLWYASKDCISCIEPVTFSQLEDNLTHRPGPKERICLAVLLAHLYLHLSGGAWWPYTRTDTMVCFQRADSRSRLPLSPPIFPFIFDKDIRHPTDIRAECINPAMPSLVEFGKLLLEIMIWAPCTWEHNGLENGLKELKYHSDLANVDRILFAIIECIGYKGAERLKAKSQDQTIRNSERMRMEFSSVVIQNLEYVLRVAYQVDADAMFSTPEHNTTSTKATHVNSEYRNDILRQRVDSPAVSEPDQLQSLAVQPLGKATTSNNIPVQNDDTGEMQFLEGKEVNEADRWNQKLLPLKRLTSEASTNLTKIAVLDTGAHFNADIADLYDDRIEAHCFLQDSLAPQPLQGDEDGHGTHMASIILDVSTACKVYTARIVRHRDEMRVDTNKREVATRIAKAIKYAIDVWKVDIISMSFGFTKRPKAISDAIDYAYSHQVLLFAAAGNSGILEKARYPARDPHVFCIHAASGFGNVYDGNPLKEGFASNFALLGVALNGHAPAGQEPAQIRRSGTSQATAVAAGVAALVLQIMRDSKSEISKIGRTLQSYKSAMLQLKRMDGMRKVFEKMSSAKNGHEVVMPWSLLDGMGAVEPSMKASQVVNTIMKLMEDDDEDEQW